MTDDRRHLRSSISKSLIQNDEDQGFPLIGELATSSVLEKRDNFNRCLSTFQAGKEDLQNKLADARKVLFNKEDLHNWLYKIRKDAEHEIDKIFCEARASIRDEGDLDYERIGHVAGLYKEAGKYQNVMIAIEPIDKGKPHFSVIDKLDALDKHIVENELIPGYYRVQTDIRIKKHDFDLRTLDPDWDQYLGLRETNKVSEGFGDRAYLLGYYHTEFVLSLVRIKPIARILKFLDYHAAKYSVSEEQDFLNHIQFRIIPRLDAFAGADYPIYKQAIEEWLQQKMYGLTLEDEKFLVDSVIATLQSFLDDIFENRKRDDENKYNSVIKHILSHRLNARRWHVSDQSLGGMTDSASTKSKAGIAFRDFIISDSTGKRLSAFECFRLKSNPRTENTEHPIASHLKKIFRNEPIGVSPLIIIIYCETKEFSVSWTNYLSYIRNLDFSNYQMVRMEPEVKGYENLANLKIAKVLHSRELNTINVYHVMVNLYP